MINFSSLLDNLLLNSSKKKKIEILARYFQSESLINKKWALSILDNSFSSNLIKANDIKKMIMNKVEDDMFLCRDGKSRCKLAPILVAQL